METTPHLKHFVPFETLDDVKWAGKVVKFTPEIYPEIPQVVNSEEVTGEIRNRYIRFGLIDNVVLIVNRRSSFHIGQWIIGCLFQKRYPFYTIELSHSAEGIRFIRTETAEEWFLKTRLDGFNWKPTNSEHFLGATSLKQDRKTEFRVTNDEDEWFTNEQFFERDVLAGFGGIDGGLFMAEFLLNFAANNEQINYDVLHHIAEPPFIADETSCELRVELDSARLKPK